MLLSIAIFIYFSWSLLSKSKFIHYAFNVFYQMVNLAWSFFQPRWDVKSRENDLSSPQSCFFVASQSVLNLMQPCKHDIYVLCSLGIKEIRILWLRELWGVSSVIKGLSQWFGNYGDKTKLNAPGMVRYKSDDEDEIALGLAERNKAAWLLWSESRVCCCVEDKHGDDSKDTKKDHKDF